MLRPILLSALGGLVAVSPNNGARAQDFPTTKVSYADLDLATPAGLHTLGRRVAWAVTAVCGDPDIRDLDSMRAVQNCRKTASSRAQIQIAAVVADRQRLLAARDGQGLVQVAGVR